MENYFTTKNLFNIIIKWKFHLVGLILIAGVLAAIFSSSYFIKPKYKSWAIVYPSITTTFSDASPTEQMLELFASNDIMFRVIEEFDLKNHYNIDIEQKNYLDRVIRNYRKNISFSKTDKEAVEISVMDEDPVIASNIVDSLIKFYNDKMLDIKKAKSKELVIIYRDDLIKKRKEIDSLSQVLTNIRKEYGILHLASQVEKLTEAIYIGNGSKEASIILEGWKEKGAEYHRVDSLFSFAIADYQEIKKAFEYSVRDTAKIQTYTHVVSHPFPSDKKAYPVRWVICLFSMLSAFFIGLIILTIIEGQKIRK